jgi:hypothetical protein
LPPDLDTKQLGASEVLDANMRFRAVDVTVALFMLALDSSWRVSGAAKTQLLRKKSDPTFGQEYNTVLAQRRVRRVAGENEMQYGDESIESNRHDTSIGTIPSAMRHGSAGENAKEHDAGGDAKEQDDGSTEGDLHDTRIGEGPAGEVREKSAGDTASGNDVESLDSKHHDTEIEKVRGEDRQGGGDSFDENTADALRRHHDPPKEKNVQGDSVFPFRSNNIFGNRVTEPGNEEEGTAMNTEKSAAVSCMAVIEILQIFTYNSKWLSSSAKASLWLLLSCLVGVFVKGSDNDLEKEIIQMLFFLRKSPGCYDSFPS